MAFSGILAGSSMLVGGLKETARPVVLPQRVATEAPRSVKARAAGKLEKPNRLWELDTTWYPGADAPAYLDGTLAGDRGFDPLRLGQNPDLLPWLVEGELYNGRVAMLAVVGILFTEAIGKGPWWTAPARAEWPLPYWPGVVLSHVVYGGIFEASRWRNWQTKGETGALNMVPFDPLGFRSDHTRQSEVRNGRLAMIAMLGFASQAGQTGKGPLDNLYDHIADPVHNNIFATPLAPEITLAAVAITVTPIVYEAFRALEDPNKKKANEFSPIPFL